MSLEVRQSSEYDARSGQDWWRWAVWIDGTDEELGAVDHVEYTLHPTFPKPIVRIADRETGFRLQSSGWGEFQLKIRIRSKDGEEDCRTHWLALDPFRGQAPAKRAFDPEEPLNPTKKTVLLSVGSGEEAFGDELRKALASHGVDVHAVDDLEPGLPWEVQRDEMLGRADAFIAVLGRRGGKWVERDVREASARGVSILPVFVGDVSHVPPEIEGVQAVRFKPGEPLDEGAQSLADRIIG